MEPKSTSADAASRTWPHVPVSLFVPSGAWRGSAQDSETWSSLPGLQPVREASHANALDTLTAPNPSMIGVQYTGAMHDVDTKNMSCLEKCRHWARSDGYDGIAIEMANARWHERWDHLCLRPDSAGMPLPHSTSRLLLANVPEDVDVRVQREAEAWRAHPHFLRSELNILSRHESTHVTAIVSQWLELDSEDEGVRFDAELALRQEIEYAAYIGVEQVVLPPPSSDPKRQPFLADYARAVRSCLTSMAGKAPLVTPTMKVAVRLPVSSPHILATMLLQQATAKGPNGTAAMPAAAYLRTKDNWAWDTWEKLQGLCGHHPQLHVALDLSMPLPPTLAMMRWVNEPVSHLWLPSSSFLANAKGYPVLSKSAQALVRSLIPHTPHIVLSDITTPPAQHTRGGPTAYVQYIRHLIKTMPSPSKLESLATSFGDWLQAPLQPMSEHLAAGTYDLFEADTVKYDLYEEAMFQAFAQHPSPGTRLQVWIVGAGHGALVPRCIAAAERASRLVHITALEKNPGAFIGLQDRQLREWGDRVSVVLGDMRTLPIPPVNERADVVVSELLGSFGDNELAPECLDGAMRFLKPGGISIPSSYMPYIAPVTSPTLYAAIKSGRSPGAATQEAGQGMGTAINTVQFDAPYVVLFKRSNLLSGLDEACQCPRVQACWRFEHMSMDESGLACDGAGLPLTNNHNTRASVNTFYIPQAGVCHGLAGYFEAHLFGNVMLSIFPDAGRSNANMQSWFPMFFPFRTPLYVPAQSELDVHMWRLTDNTSVWYEWSAEAHILLDAAPANANNSAFAPLRGASPLVFHDESRQSDSLPPFSNAPTTPMMPSSTVLGTNVAPSPAEASTSVQSTSETKRRVKIGQTDLMNAGACGSRLTIA